MASSRAGSVEAYLEALPEARREAVRAVRDAVNRGLPEGYEEGMQYGMIGWYVPHSRYPAGYHCDPRQPVPFAGLAAQKRHLSLYLMGLYADEAHRAWFEEAWRATGRKLDLGKGCVRFAGLADVPLEVVTEAVARIPVDAHLRRYEAALPPSARRRGAARR